MRVYKAVIKTYDGDLISGNASIHARTDKRYIWKDSILEYETGKTTYPPFGKLFAFKELDDARYYTKALPPYLIYECTARVVRARDQISHVPFYSTDYEMFWKDQTPIKHRSIMRVPPGTILCHSLTMRERVG